MMDEIDARLWEIAENRDHALLDADEAQRAAGVTHAMRDGRRTPRLFSEGGWGGE